MDAYWALFPEQVATDAAASNDRPLRRGARRLVRRIRPDGGQHRWGDTPAR